jgi:hypothetical protein
MPHKGKGTKPYKSRPGHVKPANKTRAAASYRRKRKK